VGQMRQALAYICNNNHYVNSSGHVTDSAVDRLSSIIRSGRASPATLAPMGPRVASPLATLLMGSGVNALQPAQPRLGTVFAQ
jgi:hypothetical protein